MTRYYYATLLDATGRLRSVWRFRERAIRDAWAQQGIWRRRFGQFATSPYVQEAKRYGRWQRDELADGDYADAAETGVAQRARTVQV